MISEKQSLINTLFLSNLNNQSCKSPVLFSRDLIILMATHCIHYVLLVLVLNIIKFSNLSFLHIDTIAAFPDHIILFYHIIPLHYSITHLSVG